MKVIKIGPVYDAIQIKPEWFDGIPPKEPGLQDILVYPGEKTILLPNGISTGAAGDWIILLGGNPVETITNPNFTRMFKEF